MASNDKDDGYMECILKIETSKGWEKSLSRVLSRFKEVRFEATPPLGFMYVRGKAKPERTLVKLTRRCRHASIHWVSSGFPSDDPNQVGQDPPISCNDPLHQAIIGDPYSNYFYNYYYPNWNNYNYEQLALAQSGLNQGQMLALDHQPYHHHCPMNSQRHNNNSNHSAPSSSSQSHHHSPVQQPNKQSFAKFIWRKLLMLCS